MKACPSLLRHGSLPFSILGCLVAAGLAQSQNFPYTPTRLYASSQSNQPFVYLLGPPSSTAPDGHLIAINTSSSFDPSSPPIRTLSATLPFSHDDSTAFTSSLDPNGALNVLVGDCSAGANGASLWTFTPSLHNSDLSGSWAQQSINSRAISATADQVGVNYLAASVSFSSTPKQNASTYTFAGMCPFGNSTDADWVEDATYSNQLLILDHNQPTEYDFELGSGRGQPISEAGFSITPLQPSYSTAGDGTQATSQNFLLLGGHTQDAFINMSQVALFSLPQAGWTFLPVSDDGAKTDLRARQSGQEVDPRSGHTAVLSSDGSKIIMFGGWVGDTGTPAEPQLAILNVGAGYGGTSEWSWAVAPTQPTLSGGASGIYGHGATMLDGDVMMIMGGWTISASGSKNKRAATQTANTQNLLFNVTSGQWVDSYVPPPPTSSNTVASVQSNGLLSTKPQKIGLGVGLTFGILAIIIAAVIGYFISKRFKKQLREREEELREKEIDELHRFNTPYDPTGVSYYGDGGGYQRPANIWDGRSQSGTYGAAEPGVWRNDSVREADRSGVDLDIPSPQRGLRRSMASRQMHSSGRGFDERRISRGSGIIHPIAETEEEEPLRTTAIAVTPSEPIEDPFKDPELPSNKTGEMEERAGPSSLPTPAPTAPQTPAEEKSQERSQWVQEWAAATSNRHSNGRVSPDKSERTRSDLSDRSSVSGLTAHTHTTSSSSSGYSRPFSTPSPEHVLLPQSRRSLRILPAAFNPFATSSTSPSSPNRSRRGSFTPTSLHPPNTADSFRTANTTFATLQSEGDALLGPARPGQARFQLPSDATPRASGTFDPYAPDSEPTFTQRGDAHKAPTGKMGSWVGSVRRAVANAGRSASLTSQGVANANRQRAMAQVGPSGDGLGGLTSYDNSTSSSPTKRGGNDYDLAGTALSSDESIAKGKERAEMRRSASEGATTFLVKRKGAKDWNFVPSPSSGNSVAGETEEKGKERSHSMATQPRPKWQGPEGEYEDEWDVERAVEARNVQVMFSVPKERLRVVNADVDAASLASGRSVSGGYADDGVGRGDEGGITRARSRRGR